MCFEAILLTFTPENHPFMLKIIAATDFSEAAKHAFTLHCECNPEYGSGDIGLKRGTSGWPTALSHDELYHRISGRPKHFDY